MFTSRELIVLELALGNRKNFLESNLDVVPAAEESLNEVNDLLIKVRVPLMGINLTQLRTAIEDLNINGTGASNWDRINKIVEAFNALPDVEPITND